MARLTRSFLLSIFLAATVSIVVAEPGFQSITLTFSETWTGNAYVPPTYAVTGSEASPIDGSFGGGARFNLVDPFLFETGALTIDPRITLGTRYYLLYQSGRVVPTQSETALGQDVDLLPGFGSARVLTLSIIAPVSLEIGAGERTAFSVGFSPTLLFRFRAGDAVVRDEVGQISDLNAMYRFFYGRLRWLRPDFHIAGRFDVSEYLSFAIRVSSSFSILDLADPTLPGWDQLQVGGTVEFNLTPPLSALFRNTESSPGSTTPVVPEAEPQQGAAD